MSIRKLEKTLREQILNDQLLLNADVLATEEASDFFFLFDADEITIAEPQITSANETLSVSGLSSLFGLADLPVTLTIQLSTDGMALALHTLDAAPPKTLTFPDTPWLTIDDVSINAASAANSTAATGALEGTIQLENTQIMVALELPFSTDSRLISASFNGSQTPDLNTLAPLFDGSDDVQASIPAELMQNGLDLNLTRLDILVRSTPYVNLTMSSANAWQIIPGQFAVHDLEVGLGIFAPMDGDRRSIETSVAGTLRIGDQEITIRLDENKETGDWQLLMDGDSISLPTLSELAELFGASGVLDNFAPGFSALDDILLHELDLTVNPSTKSISTLHFQLLSADELVFPGLPDFAIGSLLVDITLYHPTDSEHRDLSGTIDGVIQLSEAALPIKIQRANLESDWQLLCDSFIPLPGLADLAQLTGDPSLFDTLPTNIRQPGNLTLWGIEMTFSASSNSLSFASFSVSLNDTWEIVPTWFLVRDTKLHIDVIHPLDSEQRILSGDVTGILTLADQDILFAGAIDDTVSMQGTISQINLTTLAETVLKQVNLPADIPDLEFSNVLTSITSKGEFAISGSSVNEWELPIGVNGNSLSDLTLNVSRVSDQTDQMTVTGHIGGVFAIGATNFDVTYNFPGDLVLSGEIPAISLSLLLQEFCGGDVLRDLPLPASILETELTNASFTIAPQQELLSIDADTPLGQAEILINKVEEGSWGFSIGFVPPDTWNFSTIDPALAGLNDLNFSGSTLIVSSSDDSSLALTSIDLPQGEVEVQGGLNFFASLDISALGVKEMLPGFDVDSLQVYAAIGNNPQDMVIEAGIEGEFQIDNTTAFGDITLRLRPSLTDFNLSLFGTVSTKIEDDPLLFLGGLSVTSPPPAGGLQAAMVGTWDNPFGTRNLSISDVELDLQIPATLIPSIGIAGGLRVGDFEGKAAVSLNAANPAKSMLAVAFNRLELVDIFDTFCPPQVRQAIPRDLATTVLDVSFEDVNIYIVPHATTIGQRQFEQGITLQGRTIFWGLAADGFLNIDQSTGIVVKGDIDRIVLGSIFKLSGAGGKPKASLHADLRMGQATKIDITGAVELLGISREAEISISDAGFLFTTSGKIFDLFEASLVVRGSDMVNGDGITVKATMQNDLFEYLSDKASAAIETAAKEATREIEDAQRAVDRAQADVNRLNNSITAMRRTIEEERARDSKRLRDAQTAVQREQNKVNSLNQQIRNMRNTIQRERNRDAANLRKARQTLKSHQNKVNGLNRKISNMRRTVKTERDQDSANLRKARREVNSAQSEVNQIQRDIKSTKSSISRINKQIAAKKRWLDKKPWYDKVWAGPEYAAYESAKRVEQGALYTKLGGMEAAKHTALGILEAAKRTLRSMERAVKTFPVDADPRIATLITARGTATTALNAAQATLRGLEKATKTFPIDADPRMVGLFAARDTANGALKAAKLALRGIEGAIKAFPIDADPRLLGLFTARETATGSLQVAKFILEGVKQSVKGMAKVSQFIAEDASKLLVIHEAMFETSLSAAHGGDVSLAVDLTFMDEPHDLAVNLNFHDPLSSVEELVDLLLPG